MPCNITQISFDIDSRFIQKEDPWNYGVCRVRTEDCAWLAGSAEFDFGESNLGSQAALGIHWNLMVIAVCFGLNITNMVSPYSNLNLITASKFCPGKTITLVNEMRDNWK